MSIKYIYYYITSKIIISNLGFKSFVKKQNGQIRIETWHGGGAYKKTDLDIITDNILKYKNYLNGNSIDYYIASCRAFIYCMSKAQYVSMEKFIPCGMPRNDVLVNSKTREKVNIKVRKNLGIDQGVEIILYAPTWRDDGRGVSIDDISRILDIGDDCKRRNMLYRAHHETLQ